MTRDIDFDVPVLDTYLRETLSLGSAPLQVRRTEGGMSNPTYFVQRGDWRAVLRKQPAGPLMPSAHAIDREWRVLQAPHAAPGAMSDHVCRASEQGAPGGWDCIRNRRSAMSRDLRPSRAPTIRVAIMAACPTSPCCLPSRC